MWVLCGGMREAFQGGQGLLAGEVEDRRVGLDDLEVEGSHLVEEGLGGKEPAQSGRGQLASWSWCC